MATNPWFNNFMNRNEQNLIDDLVIESIQIYGVDTYYVTRNIQNVDRMFNEDRVSIFNAAYNLEMYISSVDGFGGEGDFLSKFGLQIRDQVTFVVAISTFERNVIRNQPSIIQQQSVTSRYLALCSIRSLLLVMRQMVQKYSAWLFQSTMGHIRSG